MPKDTSLTAADSPADHLREELDAHLAAVQEQEDADDAEVVTRRPVRILYMEDDPGLARLFEKHLTRAGYDVDVAENGEAGLALYQHGRYDIVAIDYKMPVYDGLEVMNLLAARGKFPPTIMLTANGDEAVAVEALKLGAQDYIVKDLAGGYIRLLPSVIDRVLKAQEVEENGQKAIEALQHSERRLRAITESSSDAILSFNTQGVIEFWNWRAEILFGFRRDGEHTYRLKDLLPPRFHAAYEQHLRRLSTTTEPEPGGARVEMTALLASGEEMPIEASFSSWKTGREVSYTAILRDITDRKRTETALQQAARLDATATLADGIAHQFNNLLFGVLGNTELLQMRLEDRPDVIGRLDMISQQAKRATELVQQMLAFARRGRYQPMVLNLNEVVKETVQSLEPNLGGGIQLSRKASPALWKISADPTQLTQLVMNLFTNAVEALGDGGGRIAIATRNVTVDRREAERLGGIKPGPYVCLSVEDDGSGMSEETLAKIYTPFFTTKFQGRGLGMAAVWGIVQHHGGYVDLESREGEGTTVSIYLPALDSEVRLQPLDSTKSTAPKGTETVLVVDEEEVFISVTREFLELLGYRVLLATEGREAVHIAGSFGGKIALALLDTNMTTVSSSETYAGLIEARPDLRVILCSSSDVDGTAQSLMQAGANAFLRKPFGLDLLGLEIRRVLDSPF